LAKTSISEANQKMWGRSMSGRNTKRALAVIASAFVVLTICIAHARAQSPPENETKIKAPIEPLRPRITANQLFAHLETHNELRKSALYDCPVFRTYRLSDLEGIAHAEETGRMEFHAPDQKFIVASENGSKSLVPGGSGRTEGHPARKLSFWVEHADFVRQYEKIDGVGFRIRKNRTFVQVRLYGEKFLTIAHQNYIVNVVQDKSQTTGAGSRKRAWAVGNK
jgi:hypothetical protein